MRFIRRCFLAGLPIVATIGILIWAFTVLDGILAGPQRLFFELLLGRELTIPGLGLLIIVIGTFLIGFLIVSFFTKWLMLMTGRFFERLPLIRMLYSSIKDLFNAFVGDDKHFDKPVLVQLIPGSPIRVAGFVTNDDLSALGIADTVAVYLPQSYNFAGNVIMAPTTAVTPLDVKSGVVMKFIISGGVSGGQVEGEPAEPPSRA